MFATRALRWWYVLILALLMLAAACGEEAGGAGQLTIEEPQNGTTVSTQEVTIRGTAPANATVRRDVRFGSDDEILAGADGHWEYTAKLEEGKNELEFFLQDNDDVRVQITITYDPGGGSTANGDKPEPTPTLGPSPTPDARASEILQYIKGTYAGTSKESLVADLTVENIEVKGDDVTLHLDWYPDGEAKDLARGLCNVIATGAETYGIRSVTLKGQGDATLAKSKKGPAGNLHCND